MRCNILYLASGSSRRFGSNKLLYELDGKPLFLHGLELLQDVVSRREDCTLTLVSRYASIRSQAQAMGIRAADAPDSEKGVSFTIRSGIQSLGPVEEGDYLMFVVADQPYLTAASVESLLEQAQAGAECASLCYGSRPGNPTLFSAWLIPELLELEGDRGGRAVLKKHNCIFVPAASSKELEDMDTPI